MASPAATGKTYVQYFVPDDGDEEAHPNVFLVKKAASDLSVGDIQRAFPLPGTYYFRFKQSYGKGSVWLDQNKSSAKAPLFSGKVFMKVSRLSFDAPSVPSAAAQSPTAVPAAAPTPAAAPAPARAPAPAPAPVAATADDGDILGFGSAPAAPTASTPAAAGTGGDDFWDM